MSNFKPNYFQRRSKPRGPKHNHQIRAIDVQVIGSDGNNLGTLPLNKAIEKAKDLFEKININNFILSYKTFLLFFYYAAGYKLHQTIELQQLTENYLKKNPYKYFTQFYNNQITLLSKDPAKHD